MLSHDVICKKMQSVASTFPVKQISYFDSYVDGVATEQSDLDILVEFETAAVSLLVLLDMKYRLEDELGVSVDVVHAPIPDDSFIEIGKVIPAYAA